MNKTELIVITWHMGPIGHEWPSDVVKEAIRQLKEDQIGKFDCTKICADRTEKF